MKTENQLSTVEIQSRAMPDMYLRREIKQKILVDILTEMNSVIGFCGDANSGKTTLSYNVSEAFKRKIKSLQNINQNNKHVVVKTLDADAGTPVLDTILNGKNPHRIKKVRWIGNRLAETWNKISLGKKTSNVLLVDLPGTTEQTGVTTITKTLLNQMDMIIFVSRIGHTAGLKRWQPSIQNAGVPILMEVTTLSEKSGPRCTIESIMLHSHPFIRMTYNLKHQPRQLHLDAFPELDYLVEIFLSTIIPRINDAGRKEINTVP